MFSLFCSFMKDFKRKGSLSLIEELKTHSKFPLIGTFLETLTGSSKEVQYHMIFVRCLYSQFECVNTISRDVQMLRSMEQQCFHGFSSVLSNMLTKLYFYLVKHWQDQKSYSTEQQRHINHACISSVMHENHIYTSDNSASERVKCFCTVNVYLSGTGTCTCNLYKIRFKVFQNCNL